MATRWILCPIVGTGTDKDAYRSALRDKGIDHIAHIPSNPDGTPKFTWCLCIAKAESFAVVDADSTLESFPNGVLTQTLGELSGPVRNRLQTALTNRGVDLTGITLSSTIADVLQRAGQHLGATWDYRRNFFL